MRYTLRQKIRDSHTLVVLAAVTLLVLMNVGNHEVRFLSFIEFLKMKAQPLMILCLGSAVIPAVTRYSTRGKWVPSLTVLTIMKILIYFRWWTISHPKTPSEMKALIYVLLTVSFFLFFIQNLYVLMRRRGGAKDVIIAFYVGISMFNMMTLIQFFSNPAVQFWKGRYYGLLTHPNFYGLFLMVTIVLAYGFFVMSKKLWQKSFHVITISCCLVALIMTGSRSSTISLVTAFVVFMMFGGKSLWLIFFVAPCAYFSLIYLMNNFSGGMSNMRLFNTDNTREGTWQDLMIAFGESPLFGSDVPVMSTSNSYLYVPATIGSIGLVIMFYFISYWVKDLMRYLRRSNGSFEASLLCGVSFGILLNALFEGIFLDTLSFSILSIYLILCIANFYSKLKMDPYKGWSWV